MTEMEVQQSSTMVLEENDNEPEKKVFPPEFLYANGERYLLHSSPNNSNVEIIFKLDDFLKVNIEEINK